MGNLLFIDSDDINSLSEALKSALNRRGIIFNNPIEDYDYPDDGEDDYDPYLGILPANHIDTSNCSRDDDDDWLFQESGGSRYNSGSCGYSGCGALPVSHCGGWGSCGSSGC